MCITGSVCAAIEKTYQVDVIPGYRGSTCDPPYCSDCTGLKHTTSTFYAGVWTTCGGVMCGMTGWVMFDIPDYSATGDAISNVELYLYHGDSGGFSSVVVRANYVSDDTWTPATITGDHPATSNYVQATEGAGRWTGIYWKVLDITSWFGPGKEPVTGGDKLSIQINEIPAWVGPPPWGNYYGARIWPEIYLVITTVSPDVAKDPYPSDDANNIPPDVALSWTAGEDAVSHNVYLGTDPAPDEGQFIRNQSETTYEPNTPLELGQTYYWRIDEVKSDSNIATGFVWSFTVALAELQTREERLELPFEQLPATIDFINHGAQFGANIIIVAHTYRDQEPARFLDGLTINGVRLTEQMLTGSVMRVNADGTGLYGYTSGFGVPVVPQIEDPTRRTMDTEKNKWDPVAGATNGTYAWMLVSANGSPRRTTYQISVPDTMRIRSITARANCDGVPAGMTVLTQIHTDVSGQNIIAQQEHNNPGGAIFSHFYDGLDNSSLFLTFTTVGGQTSLILYNATFWAELDCSNVPQITVANGLNSFSLTDANESSHLGRIIIDGFDPSAAPDEPPYYPPEPPPAPEVNLPGNPQEMIADPRDFFPRGFYSLPLNDYWDFLLPDMLAHNCNCIYGCNWTRQGLIDFLPLADSYGIRLIYQGGSWANFYYYTSQPPAEQQWYYENQLVPNFTTTVEQVRDDPALLMWSLSEEIGAGTAGYLSDYYQMVRELDPNHAPTVLHNNLTAASEDLATNSPLVVTTDIYPFFLDSRHGPSDPARSLNYYTGRFQTLYPLCRAAGAAMWAMPQAWGYPPVDSFNPPHFGPVKGFRTPTPAMIRVQAWVAIAEGATGLLYFIYHTGSSYYGWETARQADWSDTEMLEEIGKLFARLKKVEKLLPRLERDFDDSCAVTCSDSDVWVRTFTPKLKYPFPPQYVVIVNTDWEYTHNFELDINIQGPVLDCITKRCITPEELENMELRPGDGTVLVVDPVTNQADFNDDLIVNLKDFAFFAEQLSQPDCNDDNSWCRNSDFDQTGIVDTKDLATLLSNWLWSSNRPNPSERLDLVDFSIFAAQYTNYCSCPHWCNGCDFDQSGQVDFTDLALFVDNWLAQK